MLEVAIWKEYCFYLCYKYRFIMIIVVLWHFLSFASPNKINLICKLNKFIYGLKQNFEQWYLKVHQRLLLGFMYNAVNLCIYLKVSGSNLFFLILYTNGILLTSNNFKLTLDVNILLLINFDIKYFDKVF